MGNNIINRAHEGERNGEIVSMNEVYYSSQLEVNRPWIKYIH